MTMRNKGKNNATMLWHGMANLDIDRQARIEEK